MYVYAYVHIETIIGKEGCEGEYLAEERKGRNIAVVLWSQKQLKQKVVGKYKFSKSCLNT